MTSASLAGAKVWHRDDRSPHWTEIEEPDVEVRDLETPGRMAFTFTLKDSDNKDTVFQLSMGQTDFPEVFDKMLRAAEENGRAGETSQ